MGFFDRFSGKSRPAPTPSPANVTPPPAPAEPLAAGGVIPRLVTARERLEAQDLPGALAIYEEVLATAGDRADVLVTISADLGVNGHIPQIIDLIAPRYDAERHGPATGLNLLQAYLAAREPEAAQHVLDILFALQRPELEERLHGFSNAIAELLNSPATAPAAPLPGATPPPPPAELKINLVNLSKPIWFYGLEPLAAQVLPAKGPKLRRLAFTQLAILGTPQLHELAKQPEDALGRLSRALPLWFAETFYFSPHYVSNAAIGIFNQAHYALFGAEWTTDNLRQLIGTSEGGFDYIVTGALKQTEGTTELMLRVWEAKKLKDRKQFTARWTADTADTALAQLHEQVRLFMEWSPDKTAAAYAPPASPVAWLDTLGASLSLFLAEKGLLPRDHLVGLEATLATAAAAASTNEPASLAFLTLRNRAEKQAVAARLEATLATSPLIASAASTLG